MATTPPAGRQIKVGDTTYTVQLLRLGQLKSVRRELETFLAMRGASTIPTDEQLDAMITLVHASASVSRADLTREQVETSFMQLPYTTAMSALSDAVVAVIQESGVVSSDAPTGGASAGEANSPAESISSGSTD